MILAELNKLLLNVARSSYLVNDAFIGDVYTINAKENRFGCYVATPMSAVKESGIIRYTYYMYYIDRLTKDEANIDFVQSDAVSMLKGLLDYIEGQYVEVESGYEFNLFRQKFSDWCAGAYVMVNLLVADNDCQEGGFNAGGYSLIDLTVDENGIYTPPTPYDGYGRIIVDVPQVGATQEWVIDEIDTKLTGYATQEWVNSKGYLTHHQDISGKADKTYVDSAISAAISAIGIDDYATKAWVDSQDYLKECDLDGYATQNWTNSQGFLKSNDLEGYATEDFVTRQGYITVSDIEGMATQSWVRSQNYLTGNDLDGYATRSWINSQEYITSDALCGYATEEWTRNWVTAQDYLKECDLDGYATESWVDNQGFLKQCDLDGYATETWVLNQEYLSQTDFDEALAPYAKMTWVSDNFIDNTEIQAYATRSWVNNNFVDNTTIQDYATKTWVSDNFIDNTEIQNYATTSWVNNNFVNNTTINNYVTTEELTQELSSYATKTWVLNQGYITSADIAGKLDSDLIWSGTQEEWDLLSQTEKCSYLIALITE